LLSDALRRRHGHVRPAVFDFPAGVGRSHIRYRARDGRYLALVVAVEYEQLMQPSTRVFDADELVAALLHRPSWHADAACAGRGPAAFFIR
jgi:hypothetical protein